MIPHKSAGKNVYNDVDNVDKSEDMRKYTKNQRG